MNSAEVAPERIVTTPPVATVSRRVAAYLLDGAFAALIQAIAGGVILGTIATHNARVDAVEAFFLQSAVGITYFVLTWTQSGASPGQQLLGVRTLAYEDGRFLSRRQALERWAWLYGPEAVGRLVGAISTSTPTGLYYIGLVVYALVLYRTTSTDPLRRGLHDRQSGSVVMGPAFAGAASPAVTRP